MIQSSKDILFLVIAFCILWLTIFTAWIFYYAAMILKQIFHIIKEAENKIEIIDELINMMREKIEHSVSYLVLITEGIEKLIKIFKGPRTSIRRKIKVKKE